MSRRYAARAAALGLQDWIALAEEKNLVLAAPLSERGWNLIGYSLVFSLVNQLL